MGATETLVRSMQNGRPTVPPSNSDGNGIPTVGIVIVVVLISVIVFVICYCCYRRRKEGALLDNNLHSGDVSPEPQPSAPLPASAVLQGPIFSQTFPSPQGITRELDENIQNSHTIGWRIPGKATSSQIGQSSNSSTNQSREIYTDSRAFLPSVPNANTQEGSMSENGFEDLPPPYPGI